MHEWDFLHVAVSFWNTEEEMMGWFIALKLLKFPSRSTSTGAVASLYCVTLTCCLKRSLTLLMF